MDVPLHYPSEFCVMQGVGKLIKILRPLDAPCDTEESRFFLNVVNVGKC